MAYNISKNKATIVISEGTLNQQTSLSLQGKDYFGYGEVNAQNFVDLLQNFASNTAPENPIDGQQWFDSPNSLLKIWKTSSLDPSTGAELGNWLSIDPSLNGLTTVLDNTSAPRSVWVTYTNGVPVSVSSTAAITLLATQTGGLFDEPLAEFFPGADGIKVGITLSNVTGMKFHGTATSAEYADLAEMYASDFAYEPGTVVKLGGEAEVTQTTTAFCTEVFGVVSTNPAYLMNSMMEGTTVAVALAGRLPCKVIGEVSKGQRLVASEEPGVARAASGYEQQEAMDWNRIIGRALADKTTLGVDIVEVVVGTK